MKEFELDNLLQAGEIKSELELEQAAQADRKLRLLEANSSIVKKKRKQLRVLIYEYEQKNWSTKSKITNKKISESDEAELLVDQQEDFICNRKELIKSRLAKHNLNQQEFGRILGYKNKSHISELMNGINPFTLRDLIVISKLLKINLNDLVFRAISTDEQRKIEKTIKQLDKPNLKLNKKEFAFT